VEFARMFSDHAKLAAREDLVLGAMEKEAWKGNEPAFGTSVREAFRKITIMACKNEEG
jgi:hypothetical protein